MGSITELPESTSPDLQVAFPTEEEKLQTWTMNHTEWGGALSLEDYLQREQFMASTSLAKNGGIRYWILTDSSEPGHRPILASCETIRKQVFVADPQTGHVREDITYGVGSVYTPPKNRGRRYASRLLEELGRTARKGFEEEAGQTVRPACSTLWSDIGKSFYAKLGWIPCPSLHVSFKISEAGVLESSSQHVDVITYETLDTFCKLDEELLHKQLTSHAKEGKSQYAFIPNHDAILWHLHRDEFIAKHALAGQDQPQVKGASVGPEGKRVWAIWTRNYRNAGDDPSKNTMYIVRLVIEDETAPEEELASSFSAIMHKAQAEAKQWKLGKIELWNPTPTVDALIKKSGLDHDVIERQMDSIPSLMWFGEEDGSKIEWVANEKYCWF